MLAFTFVWLGQIVSVIATNMTGFAITIWVYEKTRSATALGLAQVFFITPYLLVTPLVGILVDRYNRRMMMMLSDLGAGLATVGLLVLQSQGRLEIWHLYAANLVTGTFNSFQWPAYSAAISTMVPKEQLGRANGMMSLVEIGPGVIAPLLAGALLPFIHLTGILLIDVTTFVTAVAVLFAVRIPQPPVTEAGRESQGSLWQESIYGFRYIFRRPSLLGLQLVFMLGNLMSGIAFTLLAPMVLARTDNNELAFGSVQSAAAFGGIVGGLVMTAWGGFKRRVHGVLLGWALFSVVQVIFGFGRGLGLWLPSIFMLGALIPLIDGSNQAIWQSKVAPDVQGRVFSVRRLIAGITQPVSPLIAGPLADFVLEPAMREGGSLAGALGGWVGTGPGAGMSLIFIFTGLLATLIGAGGYVFPAVRNAEDILPDHDAGPATAAPAAAN